MLRSGRCRPPAGIKMFSRQAAVQRAVAMATKKSVLVPIGHGVEEMEAVTMIDVLRRASADVTVASVEDTLGPIKASRGVQLVADKLITDCAGPFDLIALPGGMPGAERLRDSQPLAALLKEQKESGRLYAAICAAPAVVLEPQGLLDGKQATAHPAFSGKLQEQRSVEQRCVLDGTCLTSRGPGTALEFALALTALLFGQEKAREVAGPMVVHESVQF